ncbi:MAG: CopG family antitoxin [Dehalococcoidia bacterium]|nr:CopG family antitoxin [Dehalococcoidia bacterium]
MAKLKKPLPKFETEEEEVEYWDSHSVLEHFDETDFKSLQAMAAKDSPMTIRLDSESRQTLEEVARAHKVGPSTLARIFIINALKQWKQRQQISLTFEDDAEALMRPLPTEFKQEIEKLISESKAGSIYLLPESQLERLSKDFIRCFFEAAGYKITPNNALQKEAEDKVQVTGR